MESKPERRRKAPNSARGSEKKESLDWKQFLDPKNIILTFFTLAFASGALIAVGLLIYALARI